MRQGRRKAIYRCQLFHLLTTEITGVKVKVYFFWLVCSSTQYLNENDRCTVAQTFVCDKGVLTYDIHCMYVETFGLSHQGLTKQGTLTLMLPTHFQIEPEPSAPKAASCTKLPVLHLFFYNHDRLPRESE